MCCLDYPVTAKDYFRKPVKLDSEESLYKFYDTDSVVQAEVASITQRMNTIRSDSTTTKLKQYIEENHPDMIRDK